MSISCNNCDHRGVCRHLAAVVVHIPASFHNWGATAERIESALAPDCPDYKQEEEQK